MRLLPLIILVLFSLVDAAANWRLIPAETVSEWVWSLGWAGRACAAVVLIALFGHLVLQWPLGPTAHDGRTSEPLAMAFGPRALPDPVRSRVADDRERPDGLDRGRGAEPSQPPGEVSRAEVQTSTRGLRLLPRCSREAKTAAR